MWMKSSFCWQHSALIIVIGEYIYQIHIICVWWFHNVLQNTSFEVQVFPQSTITLRFLIIYSWANIKIFSLRGRAGKSNHLSAKGYSAEIIRLIEESNVSNEELTFSLHICPRIQYTLIFIVGKTYDLKSIPFALWAWPKESVFWAERPAVGQRNHEWHLF